MYMYLMGHLNIVVYAILTHSLCEPGSPCIKPMGIKELSSHWVNCGKPVYNHVGCKTWHFHHNKEFYVFCNSGSLQVIIEDFLFIFSRVT